MEIGTEIFDANMPSQLDFQNHAEQNPEEISWSKDSLTSLKQFSVRGKGIFNMEPKYRINETLISKSKVFAVKSFNEERKGMRTFWENIIGYSKNEIIVEDGFIYVSQLSKKGNIVQNSYKIINLLKIFADPKENTLRLVFKDDNNMIKRINRDYELEDLSELAERIIVECGVLGLFVTENSF